MGNELTNLYGEPTIKILARCYSPLPGHFQSTNFANEIWVFEPYRKISIRGVVYDFSQITGYSLSVNNQIVSSNTKTSTGSALVRASFGGALFGPVGAIIGAGTAKQTTEYETEDKTVITIFTNSLSEPAIVLNLFMPSAENVAKIEGVLRIITSMDDSEPFTPPKHRPFNIGDIATVKEDKQEIVIVDIEHNGDKTLYLGDSSDRYYSEDELE